MSGLGEWDDDAPVYDLGDAPVADVDDAPDEPLGAPDVVGKVSAALDGLDVATIAGGLVAATVTTEIHRQVQREVAPIVTEAVAAVLTPERLDALRAAATAAAEAELNPARDESTQADEAPTLYFGSVDEFVREFVCPIFVATSVRRAGPTTVVGSLVGVSRGDRAPRSDVAGVGAPAHGCLHGRLCGSGTTPTTISACR